MRKPTTVTPATAQVAITEMLSWRETLLKELSAVESVIDMWKHRFAPPSRKPAKVAAEHANGHAAGYVNGHGPDVTKAVVAKSMATKKRAKAKPAPTPKPKKNGKVKDWSATPFSREALRTLCIEKKITQASDLKSVLREAHELDKPTSNQVNCVIYELRRQGVLEQVM